MSKQYIVTFKDPKIDRAGVAGVLKKPAAAVLDAAGVMATEKVLAENEIGHFQGLGSALISSDDENEIESLKKDERVLDVIEDFEVKALEGCDCSDARGSRPEFGTSYWRSDNPSQGQEVFEQAYIAAYRDAIATLKGSIDMCLGFQPGESWGPLPPSFPPAPFPPLPRPPLPPFGKWPPFPKCPPCPPCPSPVRQPVPWNISMVKAPQAWTRATGLNVKVAVLDTGIANHPDLVISGGASFIPGITSFNDGNGHGTHCAGIIGARNNLAGVVGVAPRSSLYAVKVLSDSGSGQFSWILAGMAWALQNNMQVVSMSLGSPILQPNSPCIPAYQSAAQQLLTNGCVVVAAAGNSGHLPNPWVGNPAKCSAFIAVAAVDSNGTVATFSSRGPGHEVDISAPGVSVRSTWIGNGYKDLSGTSMACPHAAGAAALVKERFPYFTSAQITSRLLGTASDLGVPGNDPTYGAGLLDCDAATL